MNKDNSGSNTDVCVCVCVCSWLQLVAQRVESLVQQSERRLPQLLQESPQLLFGENLNL